MSPAEPIDVVYTWVDDTWPGYVDALNAHAETKHDRNPNRTRDNLDVLRFSLRSLAKFVPWIRNVHLVTMRPQVPSWIDRERVRVIHHDELMPPEILPTFNSFAILSHLHRIEGLSERFFYLADDLLMGAPVERSHFVDGDQDLIYVENHYAPRPKSMHSDRRSPWDAGRAYTNQLLDVAFRPERRLDPGHCAALYRRSLWQEMEERWPDEFSRLRGSRFRAKYNIVPEFLYPYYAIYTNRAHAVSLSDYRRLVSFYPITNSDLRARIGTWRLPRRRPMLYALQDDFGAHPNPRVVARWRHCMGTRVLPTKSPYEAEEFIP